MTETNKYVQHPHSKLKTQKELKKITDSAAYKKADYKGKTEMLGGKTWTAAEMKKKINKKKYIKDRANIREKEGSNKKKYGITNL